MNDYSLPSGFLYTEETKLSQDTIPSLEEEVYYDDSSILALVASYLTVLAWVWRTSSTP